MAFQSTEYRSLSSAACEASSNFSVAIFKRSSARSKSSSKSCIRRFMAATSASDYTRYILLFEKLSGILYATFLQLIPVLLTPNLQLNLFTQTVRRFNTTGVKNTVYYVNPKTFKEDYFLKPAAHARGEKIFLT
uniref:Uncharacterized protein n=1 Tax=Romanomermis culicivorax TaxID=13658 RepID=A0A915I9S1_ROMCU